MDKICPCLLLFRGNIYAVFPKFTFRAVQFIVPGDAVAAGFDLDALKYGRVAQDFKFWTIFAQRSDIELFDRAVFKKTRSFISSMGTTLLIFMDSVSSAPRDVSRTISLQRGKFSQLFRVPHLQQFLGEGRTPQFLYLIILSLRGQGKDSIKNILRHGQNLSMPLAIMKARNWLMSHGRRPRSEAAWYNGSRKRDKSEGLHTYGRCL